MHIAVMPGDDIGPEITDVTMTMLDAVNRAYALGMEFEIVDVGMASFRKCGNTIPESAVEKALAADGVILGPAAIRLIPRAKPAASTFPAPFPNRFNPSPTRAPRVSLPGVPIPRPVP